jgi:hypothetical protein
VIAWGYLAYGMCLSVIDVLWPLERPGRARRLKRALYRAEKQRAGVGRSVRVQWLRLRLCILLMRRKQQ